MARQPRSPIDGALYHVLNRGNCRMDIFTKPGDFQSFLKLLEEGRQRHAMRILGYCLMDNHWHMVLWPEAGQDLSRFVGWVSTTHVRRWRQHRGNTGEGHLYQGRFKSFLIQDNDHFLTVMRYVEANPLRAGIVQSAQAWPWSSLGGAAGSDQTRVQLARWPVSKPKDWVQRVNAALDQKTLDQLHTTIARGRPYGDDAWLADMVKRHGLQSTLRDPWRPRKAQEKKG
jgi:putative transposase